MIRQLTALSAVLAVACGGPDITVRRDSNVPVPQAATWTWGVRDTVSQYELDPVAQNGMLHQKVRQSIESSLASKGWKQTEDPSQAQLIVTYHVGIKRTTEMQGTTTTMGGGGGWWGGYGWGVYGAPTYSSTSIRPVDYTTGGLLVIVRDKQGNIAWEGLYKKEVTNTERVRLENVPKAVDELLADLK